MMIQQNFQEKLKLYRQDSQPNHNCVKLLMDLNEKEGLNNLHSYINILVTF